VNPPDRDIWTYRDAEALGANPEQGLEIVGFEVEARDGSIGKVDQASDEVGSSFIILDTGPGSSGNRCCSRCG
jgi:hypothetical protein